MNPHHKHKPTTDFQNFLALDIRVGTIVEAKPLEKARKPAYKLKINFGAEIGIKQSSAQITDLYQPADLIGKQIMGIVNFPPKKVAGFSSEALVCGFYNEKQQVVLVGPSQSIPNGCILG